MKFNEQYIDIENGGAPNSIFSQNALASLKSQLLLVLILLVVVVPVFGVENGGDVDHDGLESLHQKMVRALGESKRILNTLSFAIWRDCTSSCFRIAISAMNIYLSCIG